MNIFDFDVFDFIATWNHRLLEGIEVVIDKYWAIQSGFELIQCFWLRYCRL